jgi:hypothetical protein
MIIQVDGKVGMMLIQCVGTVELFAHATGCFGLSIPILLICKLVIVRARADSQISLGKSCTATHPLSRPLIFLALGYVPSDFGTHSILM